MKIKMNIFILILTFLLSPSMFSTTDQPIAFDTPVGYWKTIDDKTGETKSIVEIYLTSDGTLKGKIVKIFPKPNVPPNPKCLKCKGEFYNKPILGMEFMWGFKGKGTEWKDGKILDPHNGSIYNCQLEMDKDGKKLNVFGYIRVLFKVGRSQTWIRQIEI